MFLLFLAALVGCVDPEPVTVADHCELALAALCECGNDIGDCSAEGIATQCAGKAKADTTDPTEIALFECMEAGACDDTWSECERE